MTDVKCKVQSCHYWGHGDVCEANSIMVDNNKRLSSFGKMETGSLDITDNTGRSSSNSGETGGNHAHRSEETLCKTFRPKDTKTGG